MLLGSVVFPYGKHSFVCPEAFKIELCPTILTNVFTDWYMAGTLASECSRVSSGMDEYLY